MEHTSLRKPSRPCKKNAKVAVLCAVIALIWAVLALPTVFYHLPEPADREVTGTSKSSSANTSTVDGAGNETLQLNSSNPQCSPEIYTGTICRSALQSLQGCIPDLCNSTEIYVSTDGRQSLVESQLTRLLGGLQLLSPSPACQGVVVPFMCLYYFSLCDSGELYRPSSEDCITIASETCAVEFQTAVSLLGRESLPQCDLLSASSSSTLEVGCSGQCSEEGTDAIVLRCSDGFYLDQENGSTGVCIPDCGTWEEFPHHVIAVSNAFAITQAVVYIISATLLLVIACFEHKRMFKFPAIFIIYEMIPLGVFDVFLLIGQMDRTRLFCSSRNLLESIEHSTVFCNFQGAIVYFVALQQTLLWTFHTAALLWTFKFPLHAKSFEAKGYTKYVHFAMLALAFILPFICISIVFGTGGCRLARFPNILCLANEPDVTFHALVLPLSILTAAGMTMLALIFWFLYHVTKAMPKMQPKKQETKRNTKGSIKKKLSTIKQHTTMTKPEVKVLIILVYYALFLAGIISSFTVRLYGINNLIMDIREYFTCEAVGVMPGKVCERSFERLGSEIISVISYSLIGLYPIVNLIYVVNVQELKQKVLRLFGRGGHLQVTSFNSSSSKVNMKSKSMSV